jgi:dephospho-CoA kinase
MLLVGLTGNYGMGKSIVLSQFEKLGAVTLDSDKIVESLLSEAEVIKKIKDLLGNKAFDEDGNLMKKKVADLIFKNDILKSSVEDLLHPLVFEKIESFLKTITNQHSVVVIEVPLLFESLRGLLPSLPMKRPHYIVSRKVVSQETTQCNGYGRSFLLR